MKIGAAARAAGLPVKTVRYYADIGLVVPDGRSNSGYRQYSDVELRKLIFARHARSFGFSIDQTRELLSLYGDCNRSSADVKQIATKRLDDIRTRMSELQELHDELAHLVDTCRGDARPDCPIISSLAAPDKG
ncbi:MAG: Cu(I)-responsive transcriptional regulator [Pseudomonadota bacterium]